MVERVRRSLCAISTSLRRSSHRKRTAFAAEAFGLPTDGAALAPLASASTPASAVAPQPFEDRPLRDAGPCLAIRLTGRPSARRVTISVRL